MATLRKIAIIKTSTGEPIRRAGELAAAKASSHDLTYTLIPGEIKKNYCKIMINIRTANGDKPFQLNYMKEMIMRYGKDRVEKHYRSGHVRPERQPIEGPRANQLISELQQQNYLKYVGTAKRDKLHPNIPEDGIKFYIFDKFKIIECEESKYFKQKLQKATEKVELKSSVSLRRCKALRQIYAQFGDKIPFTYEMVRNIPKFYQKMAEDKTQNLNDDSKFFYKAAAQYSESTSSDFLDIWNSLIRNNFLIPYKVRAKDGTIKVRPGAYKVNMDFVRDCLAITKL
jgi:hypothetical protein